MRIVLRKKNWLVTKFLLAVLEDRVGEASDGVPWKAVPRDNSCGWLFSSSSCSSGFAGVGRSHIRTYLWNSDRRQILSARPWPHKYHLILHATTVVVLARRHDLTTVHFSAAVADESFPGRKELTGGALQGAAVRL